MVGELITIRSYFNQTDAYLAQSRLESAGVRTFLADENMVNTNWFYSIAMGGMRLMVQSDDADAALRILDDKAEALLPVAAADQVHCPKCGSSNTWRGYSTILWWLHPVHWFYPIVLFLCGSVFPPPILRHTWRCRDCGHRWRGRGR